ncbi:hypothetical protein, partial [Flavobacterium psychrophilum]|uniref:hypothetical protein n=1 Tax=Flavobacterium psychrophilum TaxID=96345 RepID=UPI001D08977A
HQHDPNATALWLYFQSVITWVNATFTNKRKKFMKGIQAHVKNMGRSLKFGKKTNGFFNIFFLFT